MHLFRVGVTPDFYRDARGRFETALEQKLGGVAGIEYAPLTAETLDDFDAIFALGFKMTRESVRDLKRLTLVARWGVGYDMIDVDALTEADIALAITPNAVKRPVAEAILTLIFALVKNLREQDRIIREGKWRGDLSALGGTLEGKTLGSIGCGNIAREMFRLSASLGFARFMAYDPFVNDAGPGIDLVSLDEVLRADFVTVNTLLNAQTRGLIGERELRLMKTTAYLINTSRGPIVDQAALTQALRQRRIAGAGLDVFESEPVPRDEPLLALDNVVLAPHCLAWTTELARDNGLEACDHILSVFRGEVPEGVVNRDVLERPGFRAKLQRYLR